MDPLTIAPFLALLAAVLGLWIHRLVWMFALLVAIGLGYQTGALYGLAALWIAIGVALAGSYVRVRALPSSPRTRALTICLGVSFALYALALAIPVLPGFTRVELVSAQVLSPGAVPYALGVGFPKVVAGLLILGLINPQVLSRSGMPRVLGSAAPVLLITVIATSAFALATGYTAFAPKWNDLFLTWAVVNLFSTCLAEEAFFRGFVQQELSRAGQFRAGSAALALVIGAVAFGLLHYKGGSTYVVAGIIAGLGCGWAYLRTRRIEAAMAVHLGVNATHFLLFVYPRIA